MAIKNFNKVMTRPMNLIDCACWDVGERLELPQRFHDLLFFDPLFIHTPKKGVSVYYNFTDPKQDPTPLLNYLNTHFSEFLNMKDHFDRICQKVRLMIKEQSLDHVDLFNSIKEIWPIMAVANIFGSGDFSSSKDLHKLSIKIREESDNVFHAGVEYLSTIIAKKIPLNYSVNTILLSEFIDNNLPTKKELEKREGMWLYYKGNCYTDIPEFLLSEQIKLWVPEAFTVDKLLIKGRTACQGKIQGIAKIVFELPELSKIEKNDILISPMTIPEMVPVFGKIAGIVTDEGGMTCHAAIVSREHKIPCVVGTTIATKMIQDGDLIEVDATAGEVRILKKAL